MNQGLPSPVVAWLALALLAAAALVGTMLGRTHRRLRRSEQRLRDLFDHAADGIFVADTSGRYTEVNDAGCQMLGLQRDEIIGRTIADFIPPQDLPRLAQAREWLLAGHSQVAEWTLRCKNGDWLPVEISTRILPSGQWQAFVRDVRERQQAQAQLQLAAAVFSSTQEGIIVTDARRRILAVNPAFSAISGYSADELLGRDPSLQQSGRHDRAFYEGVWDALNRTDQWRGEIWNRRKNGEIYPAWENISRIRDASGEVTHYVAIQSDITPIKDAEERLRHLAHHDLLTGLPNRLLFANALQLSMARAARHGQRLALLFIDLDRFKFVNDSLGHAAGDQLLIEIGQRLKATVRAEDAVARLGGDEFTVVVEEAGSADSVAALARKLIEAVSVPVTVAGRQIAVSASVGIALFPEDADTVDNLCKAADSAMYRAKEHGRGVCDFYTPDITERVHEHLMLDNALRQALQRQEFRLLFQPQFDATGQVLVGVEALLRWQHPQAGLIGPDRFIPVAEQSALINEMGAWTLDQACAQLRVWRDQGLAPVRMAVNVSGRQVLHDHLVEAVEAALQRHGLQADGRWLELELTESVLQSMEPSAEVLTRLRTLGVRIAIDDFGTGYSSLSMLKHLPIDTLKIDRLFVRNLPDDGNSRAIVSAVVSMSHALGLRVVAEGVETVAQKDFLAEAGCDDLQGFLLGRPDTAEAVTALLAARDGPPQSGCVSA